MNPAISTIAAHPSIARPRARLSQADIDQFYALPRLLPATYLGVPTGYLPTDIRTWRNYVIICTCIELGLGIASLPLSAVRSGLAKVSTGLNVVMIVLAIIGLHGAGRLNRVLLLLHFGCVTAILSIFTLYVILFLSLSKYVRLTTNLLLPPALDATDYYSQRLVQHSSSPHHALQICCK